MQASEAGVSISHPALGGPTVLGVTCGKASLGDSPKTLVRAWPGRATPEGGTTIHGPAELGLLRTTLPFGSVAPDGSVTCAAPVPTVSNNAPRLAPVESKIRFAFLVNMTRSLSLGAGFGVVKDAQPGAASFSNDLANAPQDDKELLWRLTSSGCFVHKSRQPANGSFPGEADFPSLRNRDPSRS
jgi:hypothetical protein